MTFCGHRIDIGHMKALLRELGFKWNGAACSLQHFFQQIKEYLSTENKPRAARESNHFDIDVNLPKTRVFNCTAEETKLIDLKVQKKIPVIDIVREVFYNSKKTLYQIFREFRTIDRQHDVILNRNNLPLRNKFFSIINIDLPCNSLNCQIT